MFEDKIILITGGTGFFGQEFVTELLQSKSPKKIIIYSRDEMKQWEMQNKFKNDPRLRFFLGDVRDKERLQRALNGVNFVIHAAALKIVPTAEYNPFECVKTNIIGAMNIIDACIDKKVEKVVALSTDKACAPINLYGATKLASDKLFVAANNYKGSRDIRFSVVRYGNVMGSNGSVIPFFINKKKEGILPITSEKMTRFNISLQGGVDMVMHALEHAWGSELFVPKIPSYKILDVAEAIGPECEKPVVGIRPGEKIHEEMITPSDSYNTYDLGKYYTILPTITPWDLEEFKSAHNAKQVPEGFSYNSGDNEEWETVDSLRELISEHVDSTFKV